MKKILLCLITFVSITFPLHAVEKETVVLRQWDNNKNIEYLEYAKENSFGDLRSYMIKSVYGDLQDTDNKGGYNISIKKYLMNCNDEVFILKKTYLLNDDDLVQYNNYDEAYYMNDPTFGWKSLNTAKVQNKIWEIFCK